VRAQDESLAANFTELGLDSRFLGVLAGDASLPPWRTDTPWLDCIVTDPPYGIREAVNRVGSNKDYSNTCIPEEHLATHFPEKVSYSLPALLTDLLNFSATSLVAGGRLVYWLPVIRQHYSPAHLPAHPALKLVADCEQVLSSQTARRLIVLERLAGRLKPGAATVSPELSKFSEQWALPVAGRLSRKERKERLRQHGHLNLTQQEVEQWSHGPSRPRRPLTDS